MDAGADVLQNASRPGTGTDAQCVRGHRHHRRRGCIRGGGITSISSSRRMETNKTKIQVRRFVAAFGSCAERGAWEMRSAHRQSGDESPHSKVPPFSLNHGCSLT